MRSLSEHSTPLEEIYSQSLCSRKISRAHLLQIQAIKLSSSLNSQHNRLVKRILHASRRGWISVID